MGIGHAVLVHGAGGGAWEWNEDVPPTLTETMAAQWHGEAWRVPGGHVSPLLGRQAPQLAARMADWLSAA